MTTPAEQGPPPGLASLVRRVIARFSGRNTEGTVARGAIASLAIQVGGAAVSFGGQILLSRALGQFGFGTYLVALAAMNAATVLAKWELDNASTKFLSEYLGGQRLGLARGFVTWSRRSLTVASAIAAVLGLLAIALWRVPLLARNPAYPATLAAACVLLPINARLLLNSAHLQALQRFAQAQLAGTLLRPALLAATVTTIHLVAGRELSPTHAVLLNATTASLAVAITAAFLYRAWPAGLWTAAPERDVPAWRGAISGLIIVGISQLVVSQTIDILVVGTMLSPAQSALYGAASQLTQLLTFGQMSVSFVAAPMIADYFARKRHEDLQRVIRIAMGASALVTLPVSVVLLLFGPWVLRLYGDGFDSAFPVLVVLTVSSSFSSIVGSIAGFLLTMTSYQQDAARIIGGSAVLNLVLTVILTSRFGMVGTAVATLTAAVFRGVALSVFIRRRMGLRVMF